MEEYSVRIRKLRREQDLTQQQLADKLGVSKSAVSMYERGERRPNFEVADSLAAYFDCSIGYISGSSDLRGSYPRAYPCPDEDNVDKKEADLDPSERQVLEAYRRASDEIKSVVERILLLK